MGMYPITTTASLSLSIIYAVMPIHLLGLCNCSTRPIGGPHHHNFLMTPMSAPLQLELDLDYCELVTSLFLNVFTISALGLSYLLGYISDIFVVLIPVHQNTNTGKSQNSNCGSVLSHLFYPFRLGTLICPRSRYTNLVERHRSHYLHISVFPEGGASFVRLCMLDRSMTLMWISSLPGTHTCYMCPF